MLGLIEWGRRDYGQSLEQMRQLRAQRRAGEIPDTLILVEHDPVITVGVQGSDGDTFPRGVPVYHVERGGKSTFHGPGQLVGYAIVDLEARGRDVRRFVRDLEEIVIEAVADFGIRATRVAGRRGVWVDGERKIASVGVAVEQWVTFHGFALNVRTDLETFRKFRPCGFDGRVMTSITQERGRTYEVSVAHLPVIRAWERVFGGPIQETAPVPSAPPVPR
ncbi:MAG: lipoyl(octanoyl) transferase LipB [Thermoplasmata archaeon]|nr:lipoyl(octanoyl) transferase LipB [Thermoplasmata archaeon]